jgi:hypothetical protein
MCFADMFAFIFLIFAMPLVSTRQKPKYLVWFE